MLSRNKKLLKMAPDKKVKTSPKFKSSKVKETNSKSATNKNGKSVIKSLNKKSGGKTDKKNSPNAAKPKPGDKPSKEVESKKSARKNKEEISKAETPNKNDDKKQSPNKKSAKNPGTQSSKIEPKGVTTTTTESKKQETNAKIKGFVPPKKSPVKVEPKRVRKTAKKFDDLDSDVGQKEDVKKSVKKPVKKPPVSKNTEIKSPSSVTKKAAQAKHKEKVPSHNEMKIKETSSNKKSLPTKAKISTKSQTKISSADKTSPKKPDPKKKETPVKDESDDDEEDKKKPTGKSRQSRSVETDKSKAGKRMKSKDSESQSLERRGRPVLKKDKIVPEPKKGSKSKSPLKSAKKTPGKRSYSSKSDSESEDDSTKKSPSKLKKKNEPATKKAKKPIKKDTVTPSNTKPLQTEEPSGKTSKIDSKKAVLIKKKSIKVKQAQMKLKQMQSLGFWGAPPRRAASLNAAAVMHCLYDTQQPVTKTATSNNDIKIVEPSGKKENEEPKSQKVKSEISKNKDEETSSDEEVSFSQKMATKESLKQADIIKKKKKLQPKGKDAKSSVDKSKAKKVTTNKAAKSSGQKKRKEAQKSEDKVVYSNSDSGSESEDEKPLPKKQSEVKEVKKPTQPVVKKKKKTLKDEFKMDIRDMIVQKRIASLNASAIMSATAYRWKPTVTQQTNKTELKAIEYLPSTPITSTPIASTPVSTIPKIEPEKKEIQKEGKRDKKEKKEKKKKELKLLPKDEPEPERKKKQKKEQSHIIVEIEDERIKSQLIASAMKKTVGKSSNKSSSKRGKRTHGERSSSSENNTVVMMRGDFIKSTASSQHEPSKDHNKHKYQVSDKPQPKKRRTESRKPIVVDGSSSSNSDSSYSDTEYSSEEEPMEEIVTDGARGSSGTMVCPGSSGSLVGLNLSGRSSNPVAMKTEMNKVDLIVDGRMPGMYQVVHRFETISTTTAVVPRTPGNEHQGSDQSVNSSSHEGGQQSGKYTPLNALASLQPGGSVNQDSCSGSSSNSGQSSRFHSSFPSFTPHQGYYQPAGPVIGSASPGSSVAPPTATVQPTVVSSTTSSLAYNRGSTIEQSQRRDDYMSINQSKESPRGESPIKLSTYQHQQQHIQQHTQQQQTQPGFIQHPGHPPGFPYAAPYPAYAHTYPTSADIYRAAVPPPAHVVHAGMAGTPFYASQLSAIPPHPHHPPQHIPYAYSPDFRPPYPSIYQPATQATMAPQGSYYLATPASEIPIHPTSSAPSTSTSATASNTQLALPAHHHVPAAYYYSGYTYPYSAGRIIAPVLALAHPSSGHPPNQTSFYSYSVQQHPSMATATVLTPPHQSQPQPQPQQPHQQQTTQQQPVQPPPQPIVVQQTTPTPSTPSSAEASDSSAETPPKNVQAGPPAVGKGSISELGPTDFKSDQQQRSGTSKPDLPKKSSDLTGKVKPIIKEKPAAVVTKPNTTTEPPPISIINRPIVPPVTNLPSGVVLPTTPLHPQQIQCSVRPHKAPMPPLAKNTQQLTTTYSSPVSPTTIQAMLANVKPVVSMAAMCGKSTLRNYRRPKSRQQSDPIKADTSNGNLTFQNVIGTRALPSDISVTPIVGKVSSVSDSKRPIEHQAPSVSCYPINKEVEPGSLSTVQERIATTTPMSIEDLVAAKKLKDEQSPSQPNNRAFQLPKGLTITEVSSGTKHEKKPQVQETKGPPNVYEVQALPVLHIPEVSVGDHYDLLKKFDEANLPNNKKQPVKSNGMLGGHPGMPNGLLRMTASLQQKSDYNRPGVGRITTKVTPKDLKSQLALSKMGFGDGNLNTSFQQENSCPSTITVSMAESAASAVSILNSRMGMKPLVPNLKQKQKNLNGAQNKQSPASSRSSSRNSSISPRDRTGSVSINYRSSSSSRIGSTITVTPKPGGSTSSQVSPKPLFRHSSGKKKSGNTLFVGPLIPWAKRNFGPPKHSNGWSWQGDGTEQAVYLNNDDPPVHRICYPSIKHVEGDVIKPRDCIIVASGHRKKDLPFIAKVTAIWEDPDDGEMFMSLLWYYRPEHIESGRRFDDLPDEIYASRHRDFTSVACIEDKCYVMTFNEYCRYRKFLRMVEQRVPPQYSIVPELMDVYERASLLPRCRVAPDRVFLCRKVYESRQKRVLKNPY